MPSHTNALTHGLFAISPVLPGEDPAPFEALLQQLLQDLAPANLLEQELTADLANLRWRLDRCQSLENKILADVTMPVEDQITALAKFSLYEHRLTRKFTQTLKQLQTLQAERRLQHEAEMHDAITIAAQCAYDAKPFDPAAFGFVFSKSEIDVRLLRHQRLQSNRTRAQAA